MNIEQKAFLCVIIVAILAFTVVVIVKHRKINYTRKRAEKKGLTGPSGPAHGFTGPWNGYGSSGHTGSSVGYTGWKSPKSAGTHTPGNNKYIIGADPYKDKDLDDEVSFVTNVFKVASKEAQKEALTQMIKYYNEKI